MKIAMPQPYEVWIEAEHWAPGQGLPHDSNSDVLVTFADGTRWTATFFSYENIRALRINNQETGEFESACDGPHAPAV